MGMKSVLMPLAAMRLSRFITSDKLGDWLIVRPAQEWAIRHEGGEIDPDLAVLVQHEGETDYEFEERLRGHLVPDEENGWRSKLVSGLECPFCAGFWAGAALLAADMALPREGVARTAFTWGTRALAMNYVAGHISSRLDYDNEEG